MKELFFLSLEKMKKQKRDTILLFMVLSISFAFSLVSLSIMKSMDKTNEEYRYSVYGEWDAAFLDGQEKDADFLKADQEVEAVGTARKYGHLRTGAGVGVIDEQLWKLGRLQMQSGKLPSCPGEIVMEADILSGLGYSYETGQEIVLDIMIPVDWPVSEEQKNSLVSESEIIGYEGNAVHIQKTFVLSGVLKEYTDIWSARSKTLVGVILFESEAESLLREAESFLGEGSITPEIQYFFSTAGEVEPVIEKVESYLRQTRPRQQVCKIEQNLYHYRSSDEGRYPIVYLTLIFLTTILAVVCIYLMQMQKEIRGIALFRSIGITKRQLVKMMICEILFISGGSVILGTGLGVLGTVGILRQLTRISVASFQIVIPYNEIAVVLILWMCGIMVSRMLILLIALHQPLVGRVQMKHTVVKWYRLLSRGLVTMFSAIFCIVLVFCVVQSLNPVQGIRIRRGNYSYMLDSSLISQVDEANAWIRADTIKTTEQVPGVSWVAPYVRADAELQFSGMEECRMAVDAKKNLWGTQTSLQNKLINGEDNLTETMVPFPKGIGITLYGVPSKSYEKYLNLEQMGISLKKFEEGEQVVLLFPEIKDGKYFMGQKAYDTAGLHAGDSISLAFYGKSGTASDRAAPVSVGTTVCKVGAIVAASDFPELGKCMIYEGAAYSIICSDTAFWKIMNDLELNKNISNSYVTGIGEAYSHALIFTSMNAGYLSTDYVLADYAAEKGLSFMNYREENDAQIQVQIQTLLLLVSCSLCILLVCLLLLSDILLLEVRQRKKQYIILRAIGMSIKQMHRQMACRALLSGGMAILTGWMGYLGYFLIHVLQKKEGYGELIGRNLTYGQALEQFYHNLQSVGFGWELVITVTIIGIGSIVGIYYLVNRKMKKETINLY